MTSMMIFMHEPKFVLFFAFFSSFVLGMYAIPRWIKIQKVWGGQIVRDVGPKSHQVKKGTATMGGVPLIATLILFSLLFLPWHEYLPLKALLFTLFAYGLIGWLDDWMKSSQQSSKGLSAKKKLIYQILAALWVGVLLYPTHMHHVVHVPWFKAYHFDLGRGFIPWCALVMVTGSNAINLTDGLDGLVSFPLILVMGGLLGVMMKTSGLDAWPLLAIGVAFIGVLLAFLWFNAMPATLFMGDVGSLSFGAFIALFGLLMHQELLLLLMGGIFMAEMLSVVLQVGSFKLRGKRIFKMAPLHHHFELLGWSESKVVARFWIITILLVVLGWWGSAP